MEPHANKYPTFGDLTNVSVDKLQELNTILAAILASPVARHTYAQVIDGKATRTPYSEDESSQSGTGKINSVSGNSKPTDRAIEEYEKIRKAFAPQDLLIDLKLAQEYQNTPSGSRENLLRLLQIAAASVNALARRTYQDFHPDVDFRPSERPEGHNRQNCQFNGTDELYAHFCHSSYREFERYPFGLLDVLGFWAETELFGGVLLFEREESGSNVINAFLQPQKVSRAFQLSEGQLQCFAGLKEKGHSAETVLPFTKEADAREEPTVVRAGEAPLRIYKNEYDKPKVSYWPVNSSCVIKDGDPRITDLEQMMESIDENELDKIPPTFAGSLSSLGDPFLTADEASSSSKDDPSSADKDDQ